MFNDKSKVFNLICKDNIGIDKIGNFIFKNNLNRDITHDYITYNDALNIVLKLLFLARVNKIKYRDVSKSQINLINEIKRINKNQNKLQIKKKKNKIFNRAYFEERLIVDRYIDDLIRSKQITNPSAIKINKHFINATPKPKSIKNKKNDFSKRDYCFILDIHPDLTFEREKSLKNRLINEFNYYNLDLNLLTYSSKEEIKKCLDEAKKEENKIKKEKEELKSFINKIKIFNNTPIEDLSLLKEEYLDYYNKISDNYYDFSEEYRNVISKFKLYYTNINNFNQYLNIKKEIKECLENMPNFNLILPKDTYWDYDKRNKIDLNELSNLISKINYIPIKFRDFVLNDLKQVKFFEKFYNDLNSYTDISNSKKDNLIRIHNENHLDSEINKNKEFFEDITDINKKRAIVLDTDNVKVIAGAGTGKTFTIENKVKYLIEKKNILPEKILCLCYTRKGTNDLKKRVNKNLDKSKKVAVYTFHEFARKVDHDCGGNKTTNRYLLNDIIRDYISNVNEKQLNNLIEYFSYYITPPDEVEKIQNEIDEYESGVEIPTLKRKYYQRGEKKVALQGEVVKSIEELLISNYLFMHEIEYKYEKRYCHSCLNIIYQILYSGNYFCLKEFSDIPIRTIFSNFIDSQKRLYNHNPDFYLCDYDIYLEHFGLDENMEAIWLSGDAKEEYEESYRSKLIWHEQCGTKLIKTYSYFMTQGNLIEKLEEILNENKITIGQMDKKEVLNTLSKITYFRDFENFMNLIKTFINIFEAKNLPIDEFKKFKKENDIQINGYNKKRTGLFLDIVEDIYRKYYEYNQGNDIDHNREISNAFELIKNKEFKKKYDYILIDEYQDINDIRCMLIQELQKNSNAKLFVVGDDWQSIYKFNGSNVNLFINFDEYFKNPETIKLEETRRCPQQINNIARDFILKNKKQEDKKLTLYSKGSIIDNPIKIVSYSDNKNKVLKFEAIINNIVENNPKNDLKILALGRKRDEIKKLDYYNLFKTKKKGKSWNITYLKKPDLNITFMTIHQSKGLEYDEVIILNFENRSGGFPIKIEDDYVLHFVKAPDEYLYEEERRLLYVALTRTKNNVYLLTPQHDYSIFIKELKKDYNIEEIYLTTNQNMFSYYSRYDYVEERHTSHLQCPKCETGKVDIVVRNYKRGYTTKFVRCSHNCGYDGGTYPSSIENLKYIEKCPSCRGILVRQGNILKCCLNYTYGCLETKELKLDEEDLDDEL